MMLGGRKEVGSEMLQSTTKAAVLAMLAALVVSASSLAQNRARVTGTALNPYEYSEALVPGVRIVFTGGDVQREVITDEQGRYQIDVPEAVYQISGGRPGFCKLNRPNIPIATNTETLINVRLIVCAIADGAEVDKDVKVIREMSWLVGPLKSESIKVSVPPGSAREVLFEFATRIVRDQSTEYKGSVVGRDNISAAILYGALAIYADSILLDKESMLLRATGHVIVEDGRTRRHATGATLNLLATDLVGSLMVEGQRK